MKEILLKKLKDEKGQSLVEFVFVIVLLFLIFFGIAEFARAWFTADRLKNAANMAARIYAVTSGTTGDKKSAALKNATGIVNNAFFSFTTTGGAVTARVRKSFNTVVPGILPMLSNITTLRRDATYRLE